MKIPTTLLHRVLLNEGLQVSITVERDFAEMQSRFKNEGMSFLTITLPSLCDALDQGLALGRIAPVMFPGFKPRGRGGKLPALLSGFFMRIFDSNGLLLEEPCICSIRAIREVTRLFKKVELPCTTTRIKQAIERYISNDRQILERLDCSLRDDVVFRRVASSLWSDLEELSGELYCSPGAFGAGATAERALYNARHTVTRWPERGNDKFPLDYHTSHRFDDYRLFRDVDIHRPVDESPVRVVTVAKTLKAPRVISVEPSYMMLRQQSIALPIMRWLESGRLGFKSIRFRDQSVNRELARVGSIDGSLSTIDLKDASDLVSFDLVRAVFSSCPTFFSYLEDSRSTKALLPDGEVLELRKFASMGSALCFPVEAMVFLTLTVAAIAKQSGKPVTSRLVRSICKDVAIYGDDIIIPTETVSGVMENLEAYGLKVNQNKSFFTGFFRESCGGDYYKGHDVTPTYVRRWDDSTAHLHGSNLAAYVSLSNQFYMKGLWHVCQFVRDHIDSNLSAGQVIGKTRLPTGVITYNSLLFSSGLRWCSSRHNWRIRGPKLVARKQPDKVRDIRGVMLLAFGSRDRRMPSDNALVDARVGFEDSWNRGHRLWVGADSWARESEEILDPLSAYPVPFRWTVDYKYPASVSFAIDSLASVKSHSLSTKNGWGYEK